MARGLFGSRMLASARDRRLPQIPIEEILAMGGPKPPAQNMDAASPDPSMTSVTAMRQPQQAAPQIAGDFDFASGGRADTSQMLAPMPPDVMGNRSVAPMAPMSNPKPATMAPKQAPASPGSKGLWDEIWSDPFTFFASGTNGLDRKYGRTAADEQKQKLQTSMDDLGLSGADRIRAEMDPEGFFKSMNEVNTANMKPQTDTFFDPNTKQWMRKPLGPMAVAEGTDLVDPETRQPIYSNAKTPDIKSPTWQTQTIGNRVIAYNPQNPKETMDMGPAPANGGAGRDTYRLATPQEVQAAGLPPGTVMKVNTVTNEPTILRNPSQTKEYDPVQIRQFKKSVSGLDLLNTTIDEYENTLKQNGGPQGVKGFWNVEQANAIEAARNNTLVLAKELYELGALVGADFSIIEAAIKPATGFESTGQTNETLGASLNQVKSMLQNKMSQIPEEFVSEVRSNYSGPMASKFNQKPAQAGAAQPSFLSQKFQSVAAPLQLPPGVTQEMWDVMDDEDKAAFQ